jgi:predicted alpha/beta-hydrolase family hydrolase
MKGTVILSHGLESGPNATKVSALARVADVLGWQSIRPDYLDIDTRKDARAIDARIARVLANTPNEGRVVFGGSSMGAFVSGFASLEREAAGLFLLALPLEIPGYWRRFSAGAGRIAMVHGWHDELCPVDAAIDFARARGATLHLVDDDHRLGSHVAFCAEMFHRFLVSFD